jgi:predicted DCC family thiol-disulfide oxidoreductase YuxK
MSEPYTLILYDGVCGLCHALVSFLIRRDKRDRLRFAALQSSLGQELVRKHGGDPETLSTVYLVEGHGTDSEFVRTRGKAALYALDRLGGAWRILGILRFLPAFLLNLGYALVARFRYQLFGKRETCAIPDAADRAKFLA